MNSETSGRGPVSAALKLDLLRSPPPVIIYERLVAVFWQTWYAYTLHYAIFEPKNLSSALFRKWIWDWECWLGGVWMHGMPILYGKIFWLVFSLFLKTSLDTSLIIISTSDIDLNKERILIQGRQIRRKY